MNGDERIGYTEWLRSNGLVCIAESNKQFNGSARDSGSIYVFKDQKSAVEIIRKIHALDNKSSSQGTQDLFDYYKDKTSIAYPNGIKYSQGYVEVYITTEIRDKLCKCYMSEVHPNVTEQEKAGQLEAVKAALEKIDGVNVNSPSIQFARREFQYDNLGKMAQLFRNKISGWSANIAYSSLITGLQIYLAENYNILTESERDKIADITKVFEERDANNKLLSGLAVDTNFSLGLTTTSTKTYEWDAVIEKYAHQLLYGGESGTFWYYNAQLKGHATHFEETYQQPGFFGGKDGAPPQTNRLIFHAGGAQGHSSERILMRVMDASAIGGAKYLYTKIDGGLNIEDINGIFYPIYTTEITPKYKKVGDSFVELTEDEMKTKDPKVYQEYIEATIEILVTSEKGIERYKKPMNITSGNAQGEAFSTFDSEEGKKWTVLNDIISKARGNQVVNLVPTVPIQRSGNCALFSAFLTFATLMAMDEKKGIINRGSIDIAMDFLQQAKTYKHHSVVYNLSEIERKSQDPVVMRDVMEAARKNEKYQGLDPIVWAIVNDVKLKGLHPIEWAMAENTKIYNGKKNWE